MSPCQRLQAVERAVRALADTVGVAVGDELRVEQRLDHIAERVVHHAVAEWCRADLAPLGLVDEEVAIRAGSIGLRLQLALQRDQAVGDLMLEGGGAAFTALAARGELTGPPQVVPLGDRVEHGTHLRGIVPWETPRSW